MPAVENNLLPLQASWLDSNVEKKISKCQAIHCVSERLCQDKRIIT